MLLQSWSSMPIEADAYPSYSTQQGLNHFNLNTDGLDLDADISESDKSQKADRAAWSVEKDKDLANSDDRDDDIYIRFCIRAGGKCTFEDEEDMD
ncbi:hypothetical protein L6452_37425 [Arctium lappa]|uniref:Uncharacterized protein n=1 Tax=Arctium lappa TaxID=4217 RepID=A0ACB8Y2X3_ARCLA|nr:hypothetical protein L6452_37425 [Arctium lappa]